VDYVFAVRRVLRALRPSVVAIAETEIWPNLFREVKRTNAGLAIVNGRISDRAFPRYVRWNWFFHTVLPQADITLTQTDAIRERFVTLGASPDQTFTGGNFKYDFQPRPAAGDSPARRMAEGRRVWIAASTMPPAQAGDPDEDDAVISAFAKLVDRHSDLLLVLAPRRPERFDVAAGKLSAAGLQYVRRSSLGETAARPQVLLLDTIGELSGLFELADAVFMGGTLAHRGGHNILEPALFAKPVIAGPHMENFQAIWDDFRAAGACIEIADASELAGAVDRLLNDRAAARETGRRALARAEARRGATDRAVQELRQLHARDIPRYRPAMPWFAVAWALSRVWAWAARRPVEPRRLDIPVISVGNLTMGGTGKTPCVLRLVELLKARGRKPGILTRGYARSSPEKQMAIPPGAAVRAEHCGDEPQIFVRSGLAPVGIGADRFQTGSLLRRTFGIDVIALDDGFQHRKLARDADILLLDALNPFGGGGVFPLGRLREPPEGLARADAIVITRGEFSDLAPAIERTVRRWNPAAPIHRAYIEPRVWVENRSGAEYAIATQPFTRAGAFCGLGNPQSFRRTLERLGVTPVDWLEFEDHHRYRPDELRRIVHQMQAHGADALVTTEKDSVNLCEQCDDLLAPLPLYWLRIGMAVERESEFLDEIERRIFENASSNTLRRGPG
jgi:tetraacyldisaccharide 4'-kinase